MVGRIVIACALLATVACQRPRAPRPDPITIAPASASVALVVSDPPPDEGAGGTLVVPGGPVVDVRPHGPALVVLAASDPPAGDAGAARTGARDVVEIERRSGDAPVQRERLSSNAGHTRHAARAGASYTYRARNVPDGAWSPEVVVRMPEPEKPPPAPTHARAEAGPFVVHLAWEADVRASAGFALDVEKKGAWVRAAVLDASTRSFEHHLRLPGETYRYRLAAFNARGLSAFVAIAPVTTPAPAAPAAPARPVPACVAAPAAPDPLRVQGMPRMTITETPRLFHDPDRKDALRRHVFGTYRGCLRELGMFDLQADIVATPKSDDGMPILHAVAGAGEFVGAQLLTLHLENGRYVTADSAYLCGEPMERDPADPTATLYGGDDITTWSGPLEDCQREGDL